MLGRANGLIFASYARREVEHAPAPPWLRKCGGTTACDRERRSDDLLTSLLIHDIRGMRLDPNRLLEVDDLGVGHRLETVN